ncbi:MAG: bifunctional proline dehydrogenase/L-glutamate gamma-semialdehyde dehydrogenase PutA [Gammaproteobacteria bacterium]|nr:bifunctional proline dehydrogenase/L-glutamate gamma-semialdehyde dehydrogenase PutA [Gammaproteobacteria bacterium]
MPIFSVNPTLVSLRDNITTAYRMDEADCLKNLVQTLRLPESSLFEIESHAMQLAGESRAFKKKQGKIEALLDHYNLSSEEGIALMCLAEALLRIPDQSTIDQLISDKLSALDWKQHIKRDNPLFMNAATWSLFITGQIYGADAPEKNLSATLKNLGGRFSMTILRPIVMKMMKIIGTQFVIGQTIEKAWDNAQPLQKKGYLFSFDMLGEAARTAVDAEQYFNAYLHAIETLGKHAKSTNLLDNPGISVKLSALHPRYEYTQHERLLQELPPILMALIHKAKQYHVSLIIDAEEADRLDLSLDLFEIVFSDPSIRDWSGLGLAVQAYQKRAFFVIDWLQALAKSQEKRMIVRLVKGAYWDAEIKQTQALGLENYPVFTRKSATDVSYLACAKKMLAMQSEIYSQFGTHNVYTIAAIKTMAGENTNFEFQGLYGMAAAIYDQLLEAPEFDVPCRLYAPVGTHRELLGYLVRRLLENGANTSFLNRLADHETPLDQLIKNPMQYIEEHQYAPHPKIPLPKNIYRAWENSTGIDLSNSHTTTMLDQYLQQRIIQENNATSLVYQQSFGLQHAIQKVAPYNTDQNIARIVPLEAKSVELALVAATEACNHWSTLSADTRAAIFEKAADLFQEEMPSLIALLIQEGGKCLPDAIAEIRETIEYCRYYAYRARLDLTPIILPSITGEQNELSLHPRGVFACISPWNFPLAIFTGQIVAALVVGNTVIAKPAEQTPLIAYRAVQILHQSGVPTDVLQLLIGPGREIGPLLSQDERIAGILFTGSTATAKSIERNLANREGPIATFVAETGGQNSMIIDSSALPEQALLDVVASAFNSAGQRCSALRVLFIQEDIAPRFIDLLQGYLRELKVGNPALIQTDVGPVIDEQARNKLNEHVLRMNREGLLIAKAALPKDAEKGYFFAPCAFEIPSIHLLTEEVFGPILHIIRFPSHSLDQVMNDIISTGYGLTLGVQSRIDRTVKKIISKLPVGNRYVNRNMIGAVVGSQPFGGERLSGTGPKAGGPHYLPRLCVERTLSVNTTAVGGNARLVSLLEDD